jgi:hypothetical protein
MKRFSQRGNVIKHKKMHQREQEMLELQASKMAALELEDKGRDQY